MLVLPGLYSHHSQLFAAFEIHSFYPWICIMMLDCRYHMSVKIEENMFLFGWLNFTNLTLCTIWSSKTMCVGGSWKLEQPPMYTCTYIPSQTYKCNGWLNLNQKVDVNRSNWFGISCLVGKAYCSGHIILMHSYCSLHEIQKVTGDTTFWWIGMYFSPELWIESEARVYY